MLVPDTEPQPILEHGPMGDLARAAFRLAIGDEQDASRLLLGAMMIIARQKERVVADHVALFKAIGSAPSV